MSVAATLGWKSEIAAGARRDARAANDLTAALRILGQVHAATGAAGASSAPGGGSGGGASGARAAAQAALAIKKEELKQETARIAIDAKAKAAAQANAVALQREEARSLAGKNAAIAKLIQSQQKANADLEKLNAKRAADEAKSAAKILETREKLAAKSAEIERRRAAGGYSRGRPKAANDNASGGGGGFFDTMGGGLSGILEKGGLSAGAAGAAAAAAAVVASAARQLAEAGASLFAAGVKLAIDASSFKLNTLVGLRTILGTHQAATAAFKDIKKFANETPFDTNFVTDLYKSLTAAGYKAGEVKDILKGTFDVAALKGFSTEAAQNVVRALEKIKGVGKLTMESLEMVSIASGAIVNVQSLAETLAKMRGITVDAAKAEITKGGKVGADEATKAILETIKRRVSGGELGKLSKELGENSFQGLASTIIGEFKGLFEDIDMKPAIGFMQKLAKWLDPENAVGAKLKSGFESFFGSIFSLVFGAVDEGDAAKGTIETIADALRGTGEWIKSITPGVRGFVKGISEALSDMKPGIAAFLKAWSMMTGQMGGSKDVWASVGKGIGYVVGFLVIVAEVIVTVVGAVVTGVSAIWGAVAMLIGFIGEVFGFLTGEKETAKTSGNDLGTSIAEGLAEGINNASGGAIGAMATMIGSIIEEARRGLDSHSPSRVFDKLGFTAPQGMAQGFDRGAGMVADAAGDMVDGAIGASRASFAGAGGGRFSGGGTVINVNVHAGASAQAGGDRNLAIMIGEEIDRRWRALGEAA